MIEQLRNVAEYVGDNATRVYAVFAAMVALVLHYAPSLPGDLVLGVVAALIALVGGGEVAQRAEDARKPERAVKARPTVKP